MPCLLVKYPYNRICNNQATFAVHTVGAASLRNITVLVAVLSRGPEPLRVRTRASIQRVECVAL